MSAPRRTKLGNETMGLISILAQKTNGICADRTIFDSKVVNTKFQTLQRVVKGERSIVLVRRAAV